MYYCKLNKITIKERNLFIHIALKLKKMQILSYVNNTYTVSFAITTEVCVFCASASGWRIFYSSKRNEVLLQSYTRYAEKCVKRIPPPTESVFFILSAYKFSAFYHFLLRIL